MPPVPKRLCLLGLKCPRRSGNTVKVLTVINENLKGRLHLRGHRVTWVAFCVCVCVCMLSHFSHIWLNDLMDSSLRGSPVHGFLQARTLEQVVVTYSRGSSPSRDRTQVSYVSCIDRWVRYYCHLGSPADIAMCVYNVSIVLSHQLKYKSSDGKWLLGLTHSCILSTR